MFKVGDDVILKSDTKCNVHEVAGFTEDGRVNVKHDKYKGIPWGLRGCLSYNEDELIKVEPRKTDYEKALDNLDRKFKIYEQSDDYITDTILYAIRDCLEELKK